MKKEIPNNKGKLEDAKYAVNHSSIADKNRIFTGYMCRDKPNKLTSLPLMAPMNAIFATKEVDPTIVSFSRGQAQGFLHTHYWVMERAICQLS